jgi:hypothetical protein
MTSESMHWQSEHWLNSMKRFHLDLRHPRVARIFELMQKAERGATITAIEAKVFQWEADLLVDEIMSNLGQVSYKAKCYVKYRVSPRLPKPLMNHESADGVECKRCGLKKEFWVISPDCGKFHIYSRKWVRGRGSMVIRWGERQTRGTAASAGIGVPRPSIGWRIEHNIDKVDSQLFKEAQLSFYETLEKFIRDELKS